MRRLLSVSLFALGVARPVLAQPSAAATAGEVTLPAPIAASEFAARRAGLARELPDGVVLALGAREPREDYMAFFQSPDFHYLTGVREPDAALVGVKRGTSVQWTLFVQPKDPSREVWTGRRVGPENSAARWGLAGRAMRELEPVLDSLVGAGSTLSVIGDLGIPGQLTLDDQFLAALKQRKPAATWRNASADVAKLRAFKSAAELALVRRAAEITVEAHQDAARTVRADGFEYEVQAEVERTFRFRGAERPSFASIVGSGPNATTLHYSANDRQMRAGEMVVVDIGASFEGYAADMTRSYPIGGTFTPEQRAVYQVVRDAQRAAERQAKNGARASSMSDSATAALAAGLARIGLIDAPDATYDCGADGASKCKQVQLFYMHGLGHGIGLEVHDPDRYYFDGTLGPGSVFTIEPGVYVRENVLDILPRTPRNADITNRLRATVTKYRNIGVRIEDDYLVTEQGLEWLTKSPREIPEIEAAMKRARIQP